MKITIDWLTQEKACKDAVKWATPRLGSGKPLDECILLLDRADHLMWLLYHAKIINLRQLVSRACLTGRLSLRHIPAGEDRPRLAFEAAEEWVRHPTVVARGAAGAAWAAGAAARVAAGAAARGAAGAAWAAGAAARVAGAAAGEAAGEAAGAGWAAAGAAARGAGGAAARGGAGEGWAAAWAGEHKKMCALIRAELVKPEFLALWEEK